MPLRGSASSPRRYAMVASVMPRAQSIIMPIAISLTEAMKPGVARVTSTPSRLAASTSMLRMSTATRRNAQQTRASGENSGGERARPVIVLQHVGDVSEEDAHGSPLEIIEDDIDDMLFALGKAFRA